MSGLIIFPILIAYIAFAILMYKLTASKIVLIAILMFPFWDLIIQKGIKTYYQMFKSEPVIYAMPEFDKDGKIESLGLGDVTFEPISIFKNHENYSIYKKVHNFIEFRVFGQDKTEKLIKVNMKDKSYSYINSPSARYQIVASKPSTGIFGLYKKRYYRLIDTQQNNKVLAESYAIRFSDKYNFFRRNILYWQTGTGGNMINVLDIDNINKMFKKIFKVGIWTYTGKGWENE